MLFATECTVPESIGNFQRGSGQILRQNIIDKLKYEEVKGRDISNEKNFSVGRGVWIISGTAQLSITASKLFLSS